MCSAGPQLILDSNSKVKVTVDPGLEGRTPTRWARSLKSRCATEMASPLPVDADYQEEDQGAREARIKTFVSESP